MQKLTIIIEDEPAMELLQLAASLNPHSLLLEPFPDAHGRAHSYANVTEHFASSNSGKIVLSVIRGLQPGTEVTGKSFEMAFEAAGLNPRSHSPSVSRMIQLGYLERAKPGVFRVTHKGSQKE